MSATRACFHCGAGIRPVSDRDAIPGLTIDGVPAEFCSSACRDIAARIRDDGLAEFYRFRTGATEPAPPSTAASAGARYWAAYDRPALQREFVTDRPDGTREAQLLVQGVRCAACSWLIERAMGGVPGVRGIAVDPLTTRMRLSWDPAAASLGELLARIAALGYDPCPCTDDEADKAAVRERRDALRRLIVAGLGMSEVMSYATALYAGALETMDPAIQQFLRLASLLVATPVVFYAGAPFFRGAWRGLRARRPGMDLPVGLAIGAAYAASVWSALRNSGQVYFDSAVMFVFFLSCARYLEMAGRHHALSLTGALARHLPRVATRLVHGRTELVGVAELAAGDVILVQPGQSIPVDGILETGSARVDESLLTGESRPVSKSNGDPVVAGSINLLVTASVRVERVGAGTVLAGIARLIAVAGQERPRLVELTDRVGAWFVSGVLILAGAAGIAWWLIEPSRAFEIALAVLVVTCPCALALATPAAFTVGMSALARRGVLLRRAGALETLSRVTDLVFDKTGTLTRHATGVQRIETFGGRAPADVLALAAALESRSEHPIARAFPRPESPALVEVVRAVPGQGLEGRVNGASLRIGTRSFALGLAAADALPNSDIDSETLSVWLAAPTGMLARFDIAEQVRPGAAEVIAALAADGIDVSIASGDQPGPVRAVARRLGVGAWHAKLQPGDKLALIRRMQAGGRIVGMVGDGINDSPVLAGADVAIAVGSGTSLAQHTADCVLMGAGLEALPDAIALARRTMRVVRQNLWWAAGYNLVAVPLAVAGVLAPWLAALGMSASSLLVTFNALRLGRLPRRSAEAQKTGELRAGEAAS